MFHSKISVGTQASRVHVASAVNRLRRFLGTIGTEDACEHRYGFLDRLRRAFDERLGFAQAQTGDGADFLDDLDLLATVAGQDDVEFVLFLDRKSVV